MISSVDNSLEDENAANENAVVTADGVGHVLEPMAFMETFYCDDNTSVTRHPLTVYAGALQEASDADGAVELVSEAAGLALTFDCSQVPGAPETEAPTDMPTAGQGLPRTLLRLGMFGTAAAAPRPAVRRRNDAGSSPQAGIDSTAV